MAKEIKIIFHRPIDTIVKNVCHRLSQLDDFKVETVSSFREFLRGLKRASMAIINTTKCDHPRFFLHLLASAILAKFHRLPVINFFTLDSFDLCDNIFFKPLLYFINFVVTLLSDKTLLLESRQYIARRYFIPKEKIITIQNFVDNEFWFLPPRQLAQDNQKELRLLYHGELLWWHGLERLEPIIEELKKKYPVRLIVAGQLYSFNLNFLGIEISRREKKKKENLREFLKKPYVEWLGRIEQRKVKELMNSAHFHVTQLEADSIVSTTEVRTCLLEALAAGMPCLHILTPALRSLPFKDEENIIFINPASADDGAEKILSIFANPEKYQFISKNGQQLAQQEFDFKAWFETIMMPLIIKLARKRRKTTSGLIQVLDFLTRPIGVPLYFLITLISGALLRVMVKKRFTPAEAEKIESFCLKEISIPETTAREFSISEMNKLPFISIIIPIYRSEHTLAKCLEAIMHLDYPASRREIIIVDNNSPDRSRQIAEQYPVRIVDEAKQGRASARNAGIRASRGEFIAFTDSDCIVEPEWLLKFFTSAQEHPDVAIFAGEIKSIGITPEMQSFIQAEAILSQEEAIGGKMLPFPFVITANAFIRRQVFAQIGLFDTSLITSEDVDWGWRAHFAGFKMRFLPDNRIRHFHPISPAGLFHQFYEYGLNGTRVYLKHQRHFPYKELVQRFWLMPWTYRRTMKTIFFRLPIGFLFSKNKYKNSILLLAKEIGYRGGRLRANLSHPETLRWLNIFITD